jgi:hypothetical protein
MTMEEIYDNTITSLNELYRQKYKGLITYIEFANQQQIVLLEFSKNIKDKFAERLIESIEESKLLKIESELQ